MFQRERLKCCQLQPETYGITVKQISREWDALSKEQKEEYQVQAEFEDLARQEVRSMPLPSKGSKMSDREAIAGRKALGKMSAQRLLTNYRQASTHPVWSCESQMGNRSLTWNSRGATV